MSPRIAIPLVVAISVTAAFAASCAESEPSPDTTAAEDPALPPSSSAGPVLGPTLEPGLPLTGFMFDCSVTEVTWCELLGSVDGLAHGTISDVRFSYGDRSCDIQAPALEVVLTSVADLRAPSAPSSVFVGAYMWEFWSPLPWKVGDAEPPELRWVYNIRQYDPVSLQPGMELIVPWYAAPDPTVATFAELPLLWVRDGEIVQQETMCHTRIVDLPTTLEELVAATTSCAAVRSERLDRRIEIATRYEAAWTATCRSDGASVP